TQLLRLAHAIDADDAAERTAAAGLDAGERVLEHRGLRRRRPELLRRREIHVRLRLAGQMLALGDDAVDAELEEVGDPGRLEHLAAVGARGDDGAAEARLARCLHEADRDLEAPDAVPRDQVEDELVLPV